ncbi:unnamed protein product, partial [Prorocentrum cordatum]
VLRAALADARAAVSLSAGAGAEGASAAAEAHRALHGALLAAGRAEEAESVARAAPGPLDARAEMSAEVPGSLAAEMDADADDGRSPGTFRWPRRARLPTLPAAAVVTKADAVQQGLGTVPAEQGGRGADRSSKVQRDDAGWVVFSAVAGLGAAPGRGVA